MRDRGNRWKALAAEGAVRALALCASACLIATSASAAPDASTPAPAFDLGRLTTVVDSVVKSAIAKDHLVGVTVAVVRDGRPILLKGYGFADIEHRVPVDPHRTLFHIGSVTKLFTATATMQLWEQNKLALDRDVSRYLDFTIRRASPKPLTLAHLMTHTAGFEESFLGFVAKQEDLRPLRDVTRLTVPQVRLVRAPGDARSYSNHGILLEGYIVERAADMPFADYIDRAVFNRIGMSRSSVREPLPARLRGDLAASYRFENGRFARLPDDYINLGPSGSISSTARDMALFMIAHLQDGQVNGARLLRPATARAMRECQFVEDPLAYDCMGYGFFNGYSLGHRVAEHDGGTFSFLSNLVLVPDAGLGIFVSVNSPEDGGLTAMLPHKVIEAVLGRRPLPPRSATVAPSDLAIEYEGYYAPMRRVRAGWLKFSGAGAAQITALSPHTLRVEGLETPWDQVGPAIFRSKNPAAEGISLIFKRGADGRVIAASLGGEGYDRVTVTSTAVFPLTVLATFAAFVLVHAGSLLASRARRLSRFGFGAAAPRPMRVSSVAFVVGASILAFYATHEEAVRGYAPPLGAQVAVWSFNLMALALAAAAYGLVFRQRNALAARRLARLFTLGYLAAGAAAALLLFQWELIAWHA